jgi:hypothetical protein
MLLLFCGGGHNCPNWSQGNPSHCAASLSAGSSVMEVCRSAQPMAAHDELKTIAAGSCEFDTSDIDEDLWCELQQSLGLGNIWQHSIYGEARWGAGRIQHCRLLHQGNTVVAAMVALINAPFLKIPIAYVQFGPVWKQRLASSNRQVLTEFLQHLRKYYVEDRGLLLWVRPRETDGADSCLSNSFAEAGFDRQPFSVGRGTYRLDLHASVEDIRANMNKSWRRNLKRSHAQNLEFKGFDGEQGFKLFHALYDELKTRKEMAATPETEACKSVANNSPHSAKLRVCICSHEGEPLAGMLISALGDTGTALMSVTSPRARELRAGYALDWWCLNNLREEGFRYFDLSGDQTPGVNEYKAGLCGPGGHVTFAGPFIAGGNTISRNAVFGLRGLIRRIRRYT